MTEEKDRVIPLNLGCTPEAAVSGALLLQTENKTYLTFNAEKETSDGYSKDAGTAVVEIERCKITKFGYPNDEALPGHPLYPKGLNTYGIYEVLNSSWITELSEQNRIAFPDRTSNKSMRHFIFIFHDNSFEC